MKHLFALIILLQASFVINAQNIYSDSAAKKASTHKRKIVVFAPIFIDSVFKGNSFTATGNNLPKTILPGLDFYNGITTAIDSLQKEDLSIEVLFFDSKSTEQPIKKILAEKFWDSVSLIIASFRERAEIKQLADFALQKEIPLVSATYPNDGGVTENPFFILLNPTLKTHCEGIYKHIQKYYSTGNLVYVKKKGRLEDDIEKIFFEMGKSTPAIPLKYKTVELTDSFNIRNLQHVLDSNKQNIIICGTVNETFGIRLVKILQANKKYSSTAVGMPTWDGLKEFNKLSMDEKGKGVEVIYSTPYYFSRNAVLLKSLSNDYKDKFFARASDWFYKGYETMYYFAKAVSTSNGLIFNHLSEEKYAAFNQFDIQQVFSNKADAIPNYWENKKLYFIKKQDGIVKSVY